MDQLGNRHSDAIAAGKKECQKVQLTVLGKSQPLSLIALNFHLQISRGNWQIGMCQNYLWELCNKFLFLFFLVEKLHFQKILLSENAVSNGLKFTYFHVSEFPVEYVEDGRMQNCDTP